MERLSERPLSQILIIVCSFTIILIAAGFFLVAMFPRAFEAGVAEHFLFYKTAGFTRTGTVILSTIVGVLSFIVICATFFWLRVQLWLLVAWAKMPIILANTSLVLFSMLCGFLILEIVFRLIDDVPLWPLENRLVKQQGLLKVHTANQYDSLVGWVLKPGISNNPSLVSGSLTTGSHGVRMNQPFERSLPLGGVLAVGDSFTVGSEVGDVQTWPAQLEKLIGIPVVNAGAGAWSSGQIVLRSEQLLPIVKPSAVVVSFLEDDILRAGYKIYGGSHKPWFSIDQDGEFHHHNDPVPDFDLNIVEAEVPVLGYSHLSTLVLEKLGYGDWWRQLNTAYVKIENDPVEVTCRLVDRLAKKTQRKGIPLLLVLQYGGSNIVRLSERQDHATKVISCAEQLGIEVLDTWDTLRQVQPETLIKLYVMHDDGRIFGHMSAEGNAMIANLVSEKLKLLSVW